MPGQDPEVLKNNISMNGVFRIKEALFNMCFDVVQDKEKQAQNFIIRGSWINENHIYFELQDLADAAFFKLTLPDFLNLSFDIDSVILTYSNLDKKIDCEIDANGYKKLHIGTDQKGNKREYYIKYQSNNTFHFKDLPVIGGMLTGNDGIGLKDLEFYYTDGSVSTKLAITLVLDGKGTDIEFGFGAENKKLLLAVQGEDTKKSKPTVKWFDINKSLKSIKFKRAGIELNESFVKVYLSVGFTISILELDFYDLYLSIPFLQSSSISFGLRGLSITLNKPPIMISGGLYKVSDPQKYGAKELYNGELMLKISKFAFVALGSYGELANGDITFFLYLMVSYPIGGPPYFFVNGFALGFGINRALLLPDIKDVPKFPFVAAILGINSGLTKDTSPQKALDSLSDWVKPSSGSYFISAGIKFLSFGMLQSFALLTVEFGNNLRVSLLGISTLALPANIGNGASPIAYAQLAIEVVFDSDAGEVKALGALTEESYILDKKCHLTGGFGFCVWFAGEYKGDFIVTMGGCHHPEFRNKHYPELDPVGINWQINNNLKLVGRAYFALTPSCMMAGVRMELSYDAGNLKAWLIGDASLYLMWKPFKYDVKVYISIGVSYTLKVLFIHKTFKIELGAGLHIWGPDFAGEVEINWFIISFTIRFGSVKETVKKIDWQEFSGSFLPKSNSHQKIYVAEGNNANTDSFPSCKLQVADGLKRKLKLKDGSECFIVNSENFLLSAKSALPCTKLELNGIEQSTKNVSLGIVPMGITDFRTILKVKIDSLNTKENNGGEIWLNDDESQAFICRASNENIPAALYSVKIPDVNDDLIKEVPSGMDITVRDIGSEFILPSSDKYYKMADLMESEVISVYGLEWKRLVLKKAEDYSKCDPVEEIKSTILNNPKRSEMLKELSSVFKTENDVKVNRMGLNPELFLRANPVLASTGAVNRDLTI